MLQKKIIQDANYNTTKPMNHTAHPAVDAK